MTSERIIGRPGRLPLVRRVPATNVGTLIGVALALVAAAAIAWSALPAVQAETCGHELEDSSLSGSDRDRAVLVALHGCTAGDEWMHDSNWGTEEALSLWHGVTVDANSRVARLELSGNGLQGAIPAVLGLLSELKVLDLSRNPLSGSLPASLGDLSKLHTLDLSSTQRLGGSIPGDLGGLSNLEVLRLDRNRLTGTIPASLGTLAQLTVLNLDHNDLSGSIPSALGDLTKLKQLRLASNLLSGTVPSELGNLAALEVLDLANNGLSGVIPSEFGNMDELRTLRLTHNQTDESNGFSGSIPPELGQLEQLQRLYLGWNDLSSSIPTELGGLTQLEELELMLNRLSGPIPGQLGNLTNLVSLWLNHNGLSGQIPWQLGDLDVLHTAYLAGNEFQGCLPVGLETVTRRSDFPMITVNRNGREAPMPWCGLAGLEVSGLTIDPSFSRSVFGYDVLLESDTDQVTILASPDDPLSTVTMLESNQVPLTDLDASTEGFQLDLSSLGQGESTVVTIAVAASADSSLSLSYQLTLKRRSHALQAGRGFYVTVDSEVLIATQPSPEAAGTCAAVPCATLPLTGAFVAGSRPAGHGGAGQAFTIRVQFSEPLAVSFRVLRDQALEVDGGRARRFKRVNGSNSLWEIHVAPTSAQPVTLRLPATTDCGAADAVCTAQGKPLSAALTITIPGPATSPTPGTVQR